MNITIFNEYHPDAREGKARKAYAEGIHKVLADIFSADKDVTVRIATQEMPDNGLSNDVLNATDAIIWWSRGWADGLLDSVANKVAERVLKGMGAVFLHSARYSKPFKKLMGTTCSLRKKDGEEWEKIWSIAPTHPILRGVAPSFKIEADETYGEYFDIPRPDETLLLGSFSGGNVIRSGMTFTRGSGKIFYFQPGHENYPVYYDENIRKIIYNAAKWVAPDKTLPAAESVPEAAPVPAPKRSFFKRK